MRTSQSPRSSAASCGLQLIKQRESDELLGDTTWYWSWADNVNSSETHPHFYFLGPLLQFFY